MSVIVAGDRAPAKIKPRGRIVASVAITCGLAVFLLLNGYILNTVLQAVAPDGYRETVLNHTQDVLHAEGCDDSWGIMAYALKYAQTPHTTPLYAEIFFNQSLKFQYPLSSLFTIAAMLKVAGPAWVRTQECPDYNPASLNDLLGWLFILLSAVSAAVLLEIGLRRNDATARARSGTLVAVRFAIVAGFALTFYPIVKAFTLGQIQIWLNGIFAVGLLCWATGHKAASGVLIGLMCLVKPHYGLFVLWAALRREWRFTAASLAMIVVGFAASIAIFGWTDNVDYLQVFWFLSQHGEVYYPNQSFNGLFNRLMEMASPDEYDSVGFDDNAFPPFNPWVYAATIATSLALLTAALMRRRTQGDAGRVFDFCTMALSITIASPIAWEHHYGILLPIFAVLLASSIGHWKRLLLLAISYVLISNFFPVANMLAATPLNVAQSYLFFAALVVLVLLHTARPGWPLAGATHANAAQPAGGH